MKIRLIILLSILLFTDFSTAKSNDNFGDSIKVLILPPYDEIANAGGSPDTRKTLESSLANKGRLSIIPFPFKTLMGVPYQMIFDKKYCTPILDKVDCDIIIMTKIITDNERKPGIWPWTYSIRVYNTRTKRQLNSISGKDLKTEDLTKDITSKINKLIEDIELTFKTQ